MVNGYLIDTSVLYRAARLPAVRDRLTALGRVGPLSVCWPVLAELGVTARDAAEHEALLDTVCASYTCVWSTAGDQRRALEVQRQLAASGLHRAAKLADLLVAATAEGAGLSVLHYDRDFELIAKVTGQPVEWVVPAGTADNQE
jgi:predicted nucleic acid-binding protein